MVVKEGSKKATREVRKRCSETARTFSAAVPAKSNVGKTITASHGGFVTFRDAFYG